MYKTYTTDKQHLRGFFCDKLPLRERALLVWFENESVLFNATLKDQRFSRKALRTFHLSSKTIKVTEMKMQRSRKNTPRKEGLVTEARKMLKWRDCLELWILNTPLLLFYLLFRQNRKKDLCNTLQRSASITLFSLK